MYTFFNIELAFSVIFLIGSIAFHTDEAFIHIAEIKKGIKFKHILLSLLFPLYFLVLVIVLIVIGCIKIWDKKIIDFKN